MTKNKNKYFYTYSHLWQLLRVYVNFCQLLFYKEIIVEGKKHIPDDYPVVFAPNHQNALMDPLAIFYSTNKQVVFFARADIFRNPILRKIFRWLKILPIFRVRDGKENLQNNRNSFDAAMEILSNGGQIGIFPEAQHSDKRRLLPLKKGIPRIVFMAEEKAGFKLNVKILPIGIYYSNYTRMRSRLYVKIGKPIYVPNFQTSYENSPQKALLELRDEMSAKLKPLVLHISDDELYETYECIRNIYTPYLIKKQFRNKNTVKNILDAGRIIIDTLNQYKENNPSDIEQIVNIVTEYRKLRSISGIKDFHLVENKVFKLLFEFLFIFFCMPVFIYGLINNSLAYFLPKLLVRRIKERQFISSVKFVWGLFVIPLIYFIQSLIIFLVFNNLIIGMIYAISLPLTGFAARLMYDRMLCFSHRFKFFRLKNKSPEDYNKIKELHLRIVEKIEGWVV